MSNNSHGFLRINADYDLKSALISGQNLFPILSIEPNGNGLNGRIWQGKTRLSFQNQNNGVGRVVSRNGRWRFQQRINRQPVYQKG